MIKTFQPAEVADMDHTTNAGRKFNKYAIRCDVLHQSIMFASLRETGFNGAPWILTELFDAEAHLTCVFVQRNNAGLMFITQFEEFLGVDGCISPCDFTHVYKTLYAGHDLEEGTVVFDVHDFTFHDFA